MEFKKCVVCGSEKTSSQFSKRIIDVCTSCIMASAERIKNRKSLTPSPRDNFKRSHTPMPKSTTRTSAKVATVALKKLIQKPVNSTGYKVIDTPTQPTVRVGSRTYSEMPEDQKREILKAEYRARKVKEYREKN